MTYLNKQIYQDAGKALKTLALEPELRNVFEKSELFRSLLAGPSSRYVLPDRTDKTISRLLQLRELGYRLGIERVGEEINSWNGVDQYLRECEQFIATYRPRHGREMQFGFDLSSLGLNFSSDLAYRNASYLARLCAEKSMTVIFSMERSEKVPEILQIFFHLAADHSNLAITLPAQLNRSVEDLPELLKTGVKLRLVKGVYSEPAEISLARGYQLDERYLAMVEQIVEYGSRVACATQDPYIIKVLKERGLIDCIEEVEMLHGVNSGIMGALRGQDVNTRITCVYGNNWYLHFLHRLSENPENIIMALADFHNPENIHYDY
ncbi:L-proline dehydrogenase [Chromohalobacter canadensis]|uniref:L-proline dehydrogenase n=1 Tax=Chromohalobacter canadensis TaxID=141389 RepID=A0A285W057_9GAMM|nr:proline dehydrogenase family protein [Chromohalobacter canadensis]SOC58321.1 L-proline dehydrogenase [Chromohalobacter canadensis]